MAGRVKALFLLNVQWRKMYTYQLGGGEGRRALVRSSARMRGAVHGLLRTGRTVVCGISRGPWQRARMNAGTTGVDQCDQIGAMFITEVVNLM